jgi:exodeoxyribonuclease VII large subunit
MTRAQPPDWTMPAWDALPEERGAAKAPVAAGTFGLRILAVSEVSRAIREAVRNDERLRDVWVEGEVSRVTVSSAGHAYFALKDERSQLQCVWFRDERLRSAFEPQAGLRIVVHGRVDLFEPQGALQLYVESIQPAGFGDLALRFEALKARLAAEGLFDSARKRPLPSRPATIGVVTSPTGVVWRDISHVLARRWPLARVVLVACRVQGDGAPASIVTALRRLERYIAECRAAGRPDDAPAVTILARGGGSLEDLWAFNEEALARAIRASAIPVVVGVGHETDFTIADFAADQRAPTPTAAAELVSPSQVQLAALLVDCGRRLAREMRRRLDYAAQSVDACARRLVHPAQRLRAHHEMVIQLSARLGFSFMHSMRACEARLARLQAGLAGLDPTAVLGRGYSITYTAAGQVLRDASRVNPGERLRTTLARGELESEVKKS